MNDNIVEAKRRLPLPKLMQLLGFDGYVKRSARCPFHDDQRNSFSVFRDQRGRWRWKCHAGCGWGDEITLVELHLRIPKAQAIGHYLDMAGVNGYGRQGSAIGLKKTPRFSWQACVEAFTTEHREGLADWRCLSGGFCSWLHQHSLVGLYHGHIAFPIYDQEKIVAAHYRLKDGSWRVFPTKTRMRPLVIGDVAKATVIHVFESQWDAFAVCDKLSLHTKEDVALVITRGAANGSLVSGLIPAKATVFAWKQNDDLKNGRRAGDNWLKEVAANAVASVKAVTTSPQFKDPNEWTKAGATVDDLEGAIGCAEVVQIDSTVPEKKPGNVGKASGGTGGKGLQGSEVSFPEIAPWPDAVCGAEVLSEISEAFSRYIVLPAGAADVLALWCAHTHAFKLFQCSPRLNFQSPERGCGKTTSRDVVGTFVPRPLLTENMTTAVLFRVVQAHAPTVLADEYDAWLKDNEELRGLFNAGHRLGAKAYRCEGNNNEVRAFDAYAPAVLCGIGTLPGTLHDRSIVIRLERAKPGELLKRFDPRFTGREDELCRKLARWMADNAERLEHVDPKLPDGIFNRLADNWRPLFAIAEIAGGDWQKRITAAFAKLGAKPDIDAEGYRILLLADLRDILNRTDAEPIRLAFLAETLAEIEDRPWAEYSHGKPITTQKLSRELNKFRIASATKRVGNETFKGYDRNSFDEAFARYLPAEIA
jgi:hypothetical protein